MHGRFHGTSTRHSIWPPTCVAVYKRSAAARMTPHRISSGWLEKAAFEAIRTIFDEASSALLLSAYIPQRMLAARLNAEYSFHETGHASGIGLNHKLGARVLNSPFYGAVEEWRADGVAFEVARRSLPVASAGALVASNLITRFGIDAHRKGALDFD